MENKILLGAAIAFLIMLTGAIYFENTIDALAYKVDKPSSPTISIDKIEITDRYHRIGEPMKICYNYTAKINDPSSVLADSLITTDDYLNGHCAEIVKNTDQEEMAAVKLDAEDKFSKEREQFEKDIKPYLNYDEDIRIRPSTDIIGKIFDYAKNKWEDKGVIN